MKQTGESILLVDDEALISELMFQWLTHEGYRCRTANRGRDALAMLEAEPADLIVLDIMMPETTGIEVLETIRSRIPKIAVIMVTGVDDRNTAVRTLDMGAYGYIIKPFERNELLIAIANALARRSLALAEKKYTEELEHEVLARTEEIRATQEEIAHRLVTASEHRDNETGAHIRRIGLYCGVLGEHLLWEKRAINDLRLAAAMHDVGKIGVPDGILRKPGKLTPDEFEIVKTHTTIGAQMLGGSKVPLLQLATTIARSHHEKWDGSGYPDGLAGERIPLPARMVALADVYDALVSKRVYKPPMDHQEAIDQMRAQTGKHFDPNLFNTFLRSTAEFHRILLANP